MCQSPPRLCSSPCREDNGGGARVRVIRPSARREAFSRCCVSALGRITRREWLRRRSPRRRERGCAPQTARRASAMTAPSPRRKDSKGKKTPTMQLASITPPMGRTQHSHTTSLPVLSALTSKTISTAQNGCCPPPSVGMLMPA